MIAVLMMQALKQFTQIRKKAEKARENIVKENKYRDYWIEEWKTEKNQKTFQILCKMPIEKAFGI